MNVPVFLLIIVIAIGAYTVGRHIQRQSLIIARQNTILEQQNSLLEQQNSLLQQHNKNIVDGIVLLVSDLGDLSGTANSLLTEYKRRRRSN
jgi:hypothetical protein